MYFPCRSSDVRFLIFVLRALYLYRLRLGDCFVASQRLDLASKRGVLDRRTFLLQAAGSAMVSPLALGFDDHQRKKPKKKEVNRLVIVYHSHGRVASNGIVAGGDLWSPRSTTGELPSGLSPLLAPLEPIRNEIVTADGIIILMIWCVNRREPVHMRFGADALTNNRLTERYL